MTVKNVRNYMLLSKACRFYRDGWLNPVSWSFCFCCWVIFQFLKYCPDSVRKPFKPKVCQNKYLVLCFLASKLSFSNALVWTSTLDLCFRFIRVAWKSIVLICWLICWEVYSPHLRKQLLRCQLIMSLNKCSIWMSRVLYVVSCSASLL